MKKVICVLLLLLLLFALTGCTESVISCGVNTNNQAYLRYDINVDLSSLDENEQQSIRLWIWDLAYKMQDQLGFAVDTNADTSDPQVHLRAQLTKQGSDRANAVSLLHDMITDVTISPFTAAQATSESLERMECHRLDLRLEPGRILETAEIDHMPKLLRDKLHGWFDAAGIQLVATLPATDVPEGDEAELKGTIAEKSVRIPANGSGDLSLATFVDTEKTDTDEVWWGGNPRTANSLSEMRREMEEDEHMLKGIRYIFGISAIALLAISVILLVRSKKRKMR